MANKNCKHNVVLDEEKHEYSCTICKKIFLSVTQLLKKHGLSTDFSAVNAEVLKRKADRGTLIHKELENFIKDGTESLLPEVEWFAEWHDKMGIMENLHSEEIVYNDFIAGTVDVYLGGKGGFVGDFKTSAKLDKKAVAWQLSLYATLLKIEEPILFVFHFGDGMDAVEIEPIAQAEVDRLLECERNGELYQSAALVLEPDFALQAENAEKILAALEQQFKGAEETAKKFRERMKEEFEAQGIKSWVSPNELVRITYIEEQNGTMVDSTKLKKEFPEVFEKCSKPKITKAHVRVNLRKGGAE